MSDPTTFLRRRDATVAAKGFSSLTMETETLREDIHNLYEEDLRVVEACHHTLLGDIQRELASQHRTSMAGDIAAGYGERGCFNEQVEQPVATDTAAA